MIFMDIIEHSSKVFHKEQHKKIKRLRKNLNEQQRNYLSIIPTSELSKSISNQSITFATVFDQLENDIIQTNFDLSISIDSIDLVIVVPEKHLENELTNIEPYPFRSEIFPRIHSSINMNTTSDSKHRSFRRLFLSHRPKKLHHPIKTTSTINSPERSKSTPNILFSLTSISSIDKQHQSSKTFRQWFQSSSVGRLIQSLIKYPQKQTTKHARVKPTITRKYSDIVY